MYALTYTALFISLLGTYISAIRPSAIVSRVCQQCDSWCPERLMKGERGPKGESGINGLDGQAGKRGIKGEPGIVEYVDTKPISSLINDRIRQAIPGAQKIEKSHFESCRDVREQRSTNQSVENGVFKIYIGGVGEVEVYCDFTTGGGDWLVFQRRMDGSVDFYRDWNSYVDGFGNKDGEFWLGLEKIHQLTSLRDWELRIDMVAMNGERYFVRYGGFRIGSRNEKYRLDLVEEFRGNISESLRTEHLGQAFSTYDTDFDRNDGTNCAKHWHSAWWYNLCFNMHSNLNGNYNHTEYDGIGWYLQSRSSWMYMKFTEMKIRPRR